MNISTLLSLLKIGFIAFLLNGFALTAQNSYEPKPIVFVHGFLASGDTYALQFQRFHSNCYPLDYLHTFDWNSLDNGADQNVLLDAFIDSILVMTGESQVDLVGHSAGGGIGYGYLADATRAAKVAHYAHLGSSPNEQPAGPTDAFVPTLNVWSSADLIVAGGDIPDAKNVSYDDQDHYQVATSAETFEAMFRFFQEDFRPKTTEIVAEEEILIRGKALTLGENTVEVGATVEVYPLDATTGSRLNETPSFAFTTDSNGWWGPFTAETDVHYEFFVVPANPDARSLHYYREPFTHSNPLIYLRTFPTSALFNILLGGIPNNAEEAGMVVFTSSAAVVYERDELSIDGTSIATEEFTSADQTAIAFFLYDSNGNGVSDESAIATFTALPFLNGIDFFFPAAPASSIAVEYNGRVLNVPNYASEDGLILVVFD